MHMCKCFWSSHFALQQSGSTALTKAATEGHAKVVLELLRAGSDVNVKNKVSVVLLEFFLLEGSFLLT